MISFKPLILVALALLPSVHSALYSIAVKYDLLDYDSDCSEHAATLNKISDTALVASRAISSGLPHEWAAYDRLQDRLEEKQEKLANVQSELDAFKNAMIDNDADTAVDDAGRRLDGCNNFCQFMCQSSGAQNWCDCCSCCGGSRRKRNLRTLHVDDEEALGDMEELAEETILYELKNLPEVIPGLAFPYSVTVDIMSEEEDPAEFEAKKAIRDANRVAKDKARATKLYHEQRRQVLKSDLKATRRVLKLARVELNKFRKAKRAAKKVERAASEAQDAAEKKVDEEEASV